MTTPFPIPHSPLLNAKRGIALLVTVIFMSVMLAFSVALASLAYKQSVLASTAAQAQAAFFAADAALECALYADQRRGAYFYSDYSGGTPPEPSALARYAADACSGYVYGTPFASWTGGSGGRLTLIERVAFNRDSNGLYKGCADITIYKYAQPVGGFKAYLFSTGYNVSCDALSAGGGRIVSRGLYQKY